MAHHLNCGVSLLMGRPLENPTSKGEPTHDSDAGASESEEEKTHLPEAVVEVGQLPSSISVGHVFTTAVELRRQVVN